MKRIFLILFLAGAVVAQGQHKGSVETRALMQAVGQSKSAQQVARLFEEQLAVTVEGKGGVTVRAMAQLAPGTESALLEKQGVKVTSRVADIVALRLPIERLQVLEQCPQVLQYSVAHKAQMLTDKGRVDTHADSVQAGINLPQAFKGDGVLVGICDWGFDYMHPNINSPSEKRIFAAWDQFKLSGPAPEGFDYGTAYYGYQQLKAVKVDTSNIYGYNSHGTHCAGIIGGRGTKAEGTSGSQFIGMAPHVQFLCGSWLLDEASWMDQVAWMYGVAQSEGKRLVISNSWGMYSFSTIDGTSLASQALNAYSDLGVVFVTSAGNNGDQNMHLAMNLQPNDTLRTIATYYPDNGGQMIICWGTPGEPFSVGFTMVNGEQRSETVMVASEGDSALAQGFVTVGDDTIRYFAMAERANMADGRPHVILKVDKVGQNQLHILATAPQNTLVHAWNINYVRAHESNVGMDFTSGNLAGYTDGDCLYGIGEPACAEKSIAVAAHGSGKWKADSTWQAGPIAYFSSYGPTLDGRAKPDISAPGVDVVSSVSSWDENLSGQVWYTISGTRNYRWATMSGTSMSGPMVAGASVLLLQANPNLSADQVKHILISTTTNDEYTGPLRDRDSVSERWGYGKLNAYAAVCAALDTEGELSVSEEPVEVPMQLFPNPATDQVTLRTYTLQECRVEVYSLDGRKVAETRSVHGEARLDVQGWQAGLYLVQCHDPRGVRTEKLVVK